MEQPTEQDMAEIMAPLYKKVFFGESTPQEGMTVFLDIVNFSEVLRDVPETNATVYKHLGKRAVGLRILHFSEFMEPDNSLGLKGIGKFHCVIEDAANLKKALVATHMTRKADMAAARAQDKTTE